MTDHRSPLDRLEARLDAQAARIDELYRLLELRGSAPTAEQEPDDAFCDELVQIEEASFARRREPRLLRRRASRRRATRLHVGNATGV